MVGPRGLPGVQGGIETHAERLYPALEALGCQVTLLARQRYLDPNAPGTWRNIAIETVPAPGSGHYETLTYSFAAVVAAAFRRPDILHIHGIGPALFTPLARALGLRVVVTHHTQDYRREKWGGLPRRVLRTGESMAVRFAHRVIVVARHIEDELQQRYGYSATFTPNGVQARPRPTSCDALEEFGLDPGKYALIVGRISPEKRHGDLLEGFARADLDSWKLVIVGEPDSLGGETGRLLEACDRDPRTTQPDSSREYAFMSSTPTPGYSSYRPRTRALLWCYSRRSVSESLSWLVTSQPIESSGSRTIACSRSVIETL